MNTLEIFLRAFNKLHADHNIILVDYRSALDNPKFPAFKVFTVTVENIKDESKEEVFRVQKTVNKSTIIDVEDVWGSIYEDIMYRILEYYGTKV